jgi:PBSX family phage terminase large subunit
VLKELVENDIYIPLLENKSRFLVLYGGGGSGKSVFAAHKKILRTVGERGHKFLALRKVGDTVKDSIFAELQGAIDDLGISDEFQVNKTDRTFTHSLTGNQILCKGLDDTKKLKSIKGITGMWIEEATDFDEEDLEQLNIRIRGDKPNYIQFIISFNPIDEDHWLKKRFFDTPQADTTICHSTYHHNYFLSDVDREQLEKLKDRNQLYYEVYCLGKWGIVNKSDKFMYAFTNEKHVIDSYEPNKRLPLLISFDFNVAPMTCVISQEVEERLYIFDEMKQPGSTEELCELVLAKYKDWIYNIDVTGDATGYNREKATRGNINQYQVIASVLELSDRNLRVRSKNAELKDSRVLCNSVLQHAEVYTTKNCKETIQDVKYASIKINPMTKKMDVIKTEQDGRHFFDNYRYLIHCVYPDFIRSPKKYS